MKKKYNFLILIAILTIVLLIVFLFRKEKEEETITIKDIEYFSYYYTQGYAINSDTRYEIKCEDKCIAKYKPYEEAEENEKTYEVDKDFIDKLVEVFNKYEVIKWDGFDRVAKDVLDGDSFSFNLETKDGVKIHASGYMLWPDNYRLVRDEINSLFTELK